MKKISKYLFVSVIAFTMMISGVNATSYQDISGVDIAIQKKEESTIKKYSNGSGGIWNPDTAEGIDKFLGTMPNPVGVRVTVVNKDGSREGNTVDYVGWIDLGIDGKVYYNSSSVNNYKTSIVNKKGGVYFNSVYTGSGSISGTTIASKKYGNIIDGKDPKQQIFDETKEALDSGKIPQIFIDTAFCKQSEDFEKCKNKIIGENSFKYYILIEPIVMIDLYTSVYGVRMIENYTKILGWAYRGEGHKRYYGTPTELATLLEKTDTAKVDLESEGQGYEESDVTIDCTKISDGAAQKQCIDNNNGFKISHKTIYLHKEVSKKTSTKGFSFFLNGDAGIRGTGGALLLQLNDRPWIDDMNYALNSSNKEYTVPTKSYSNISYNEMYTSTVGYAMNIIWFAAFGENPCDITKEENLKTFIPACCNDAAYVNAYFEKNKPSDKNDETRKEIINYCCEESADSPFVKKYDSLFGSGSFTADKPKFCDNKDDIIKACKHNVGDSLNVACCDDIEYLREYAADKKNKDISKVTNYDINQVKSECNFEKNKRKKCTPEYKLGDCDNELQASFVSCKELEGLIKNPKNFDFEKYKQYFGYTNGTQASDNESDYVFEEDKKYGFWKKVCLTSIETEFDSGPTIHVGEKDNNNILINNLLSGSYFTWEVKMKEVTTCVTEFDWDKIVTTLAAQSQAVVSSGNGNIFKNKQGESCKSGEKSEKAYIYKKYALASTDKACYTWAGCDCRYGDPKNHMCVSRKYYMTTCKYITWDEEGKSVEVTEPCERSYCPDSGNTYPESKNYAAHYSYPIDGSGNESECATKTSDKGDPYDSNYECAKGGEGGGHICKSDEIGDPQNVYNNRGVQLDCWYNTFGSENNAYAYHETFNKGKALRDFKTTRNALANAFDVLNMPGSTLDDVNITYEYYVDDEYRSGIINTNKQLSNITISWDVVETYQLKDTTKDRVNRMNIYTGNSEEVVGERLFLNVSDGGNGNLNSVYYDQCDWPGNDINCVAELQTYFDFMNRIFKETNYKNYEIDMPENFEITDYPKYLITTKKQDATFELEEYLNRYIDENGVYQNSKGDDDYTTIDLGSSYMKIPISLKSQTLEFDINYENFIPDTFKDHEEIIKIQDEEGFQKYTCKFDVENEFLVDPNPDEPCEGEECELELRAGDIKVIYRPIDLNSPFPGLEGTNRDTGANWCHLKLNGSVIDDYEDCDQILRKYANWYWVKNDCSYNNDIVKKYILNNRGVSGKNLYTEREPLYTITLNPNTIKDIRSDYGSYDYTSRSNYEYVSGHYYSEFISKYSKINSENVSVITCLNSESDNSVTYWNSCDWEGGDR